jgi:hypothetical protein
VFGGTIDGQARNPSKASSAGNVDDGAGANIAFHACKDARWMLDFLFCHTRERLSPHVPGPQHVDIHDLVECLVWGYLPFWQTDACTVDEPIKAAWNAVYEFFTGLSFRDVAAAWEMKVGFVRQLRRGILGDIGDVDIRAER